MKKILHFISGLDSGGAEKILIDLVKKDISNEHYVVSFKDFGIYEKIIFKNKIKIKYGKYKEKKLFKIKDNKFKINFNKKIFNNEIDETLINLYGK